VFHFLCAGTNQNHRILSQGKRSERLAQDFTTDPVDDNGRYSSSTTWECASCHNPVGRF
jgi:hypothetical protein